VQKSFARTEPQNNATAVINIPVYLSNYSEIESDYLVVVSHDPTGSVNVADENDFVVYDTISKINLEASSVYARTPGIIATGLVPTIAEFPTYIYNETETAFDLYNNIDATVSSIQRKDSVATPNNIVTQITFQAAGNSGAFELIGLTGTVNVDIDSICSGCSDTATASAVAGWINANYPDDLIATAVLGTLELQPAYIPALRYTSNIIKTFRIKIPAGQNIDTIPIEIINDVISEGSEKLNITLTQISGSDPPVNSANDAFGNPNNVASLTINDDEGLSTFNMVSDHGDSEPEGTVSSIPNLIYGGIISENVITYTITIDPIYQHSDITFDVAFTGDMTWSTYPSTALAFMMGDYRIGTGVGDANYNPTISGPSVQFTYPAGYTGNTTQLRARIFEDYRYEEDETLTATLQNNSAGDIGNSFSASTTFTDDDSSYPIVKVAGGTIIPMQQNEWQEQTDDINLIVSDAYDFFEGEEITDVEIEFDYEIVPTFRHSPSTYAPVTGSGFMNENGDYEYIININQGQVGDFRKFSELTFKIDNIQNGNYDPFAIYYNPNPEYNIVYQFTNIPDLMVKSSIGTVFGHSCLVHRGLVSCFGNNSYGKLGKGISDSAWAGTVTDQSEVLDLGTNTYGNPLYAKDIALTTDSTCVLFTNERVKCFGKANILGYGLSSNTTGIGDVPSEMGDNLNYLNLGLEQTDTISSIHAGLSATCILVSNTGKARCWGANTAGILGIEMPTSEVIGDESSEMGSGLIDVMFPGGIELFAMGPYHACAKNTSGDVGCWGDAQDGKLGAGLRESGIVGDNENEMGDDLDMLQSISFGEIDQISVGAYHTCLRTDDRDYFNMRCFGSNRFGQLGLGRVNKAATNLHSLSNLASEYYWLDIANYGIDKSNYIDYLGGRTDTEFDEEQHIERIDYDGHRTSSNWSSTRGTTTTYLPYYFTSGDYFDADTSRNGISSPSTRLRNQHVQTFYPASDMKAGATFGCAVFDRYMISNSVRTDPNIRCWGSNFAPPYPFHKHPLATHPDWGRVSQDFGLLNNVGYSKFFDGAFYGTAVPPFRNAYNGSTPFNGPGKLDSGSAERCVSDGNSPLCNFVKKMGHIGKSAHKNILESHSGIEELYDYYSDPDNDATFNYHYRFGWLNNFEGRSLDGLPLNLNFEMNHVYSMVDINLTSYDDVEISDGMYNTCAMPKLNSPTHASGSNNQFLCWGVNWNGQAGLRNWNSCSGAGNVVGGFDSCGDQRRGIMQSVDYQF
jgi:alpha-tubulin suppressor-like RCC1 family protein